jgi:hypothetical protein
MAVVVTAGGKMVVVVVVVIWGGGIVANVFWGGGLVRHTVTLDVNAVRWQVQSSPMDALRAAGVHLLLAFCFVH